MAIGRRCMMEALRRELLVVHADLLIHCLDGIASLRNNGTKQCVVAAA